MKIIIIAEMVIIIKHITHMKYLKQYLEIKREEIVKMIFLEVSEALEVSMDLEEVE